MARRKSATGTRKRQRKKTVRPEPIVTETSPTNSRETSVANNVQSDSPDWLSDIHTDHVDYQQNEASSPLANSSTNDICKPKLEKQKRDVNSASFQTPERSSTDGNVRNINTHESPSPGLKPSNFYGPELQSYKFSFRRSPRINRSLQRDKATIENEKHKEKSKSVKRKHKNQKTNSKSDNKGVKKTKHNNEKEEQQCTSVTPDGNNGDYIAHGPSNSEHIKNGLSPVLNDKKEHITILDVITPVSSSSLSSESEESIGKPNVIINGCDNHSDIIEDKTQVQTKLNKNCYSKTFLDDIMSELSSLHSEDSLTSGPGVVQSSALYKGKNGEYYFANSSESSPDANVKGPSKFCETPKKSTFLNSPETRSESSSVDSSTLNVTKPLFLFGGSKESSGSSYSPSCNSNGSSSSANIAPISPEHQTSITSFFKSFSKQGVMNSAAFSSKKRSKKKGKEKKMEQMYLDLGQRDFGHVTCAACGMVYTCAQPDDEIEHIRHHKKFVNGLRFNGWKDEHVVKEFHDGRIIMVKPDDHPSRLRKVEEIRKVVDSELGFAVDLPYRKNESKTFLFVAKKRVVGCCVATQIDKGYPVLPSTPTKDSTPDRQIAAWCCSTVPVPAQCGISKIWVWNQYRRKKVATRLIDCARIHFIYGCTIPKEVLAFSDPTPDGKRLATQYIGTPEFLVFR